MEEKIMGSKCRERHKISIATFNKQNVTGELHVAKIRESKCRGELFFLRTKKRKEMFYKKSKIVEIESL